MEGGFAANQELRYKLAQLKTHLNPVKPVNHHNHHTVYTYHVCIASKSQFMVLALDSRLSRLHRSIS
jgi:hypothetical protein